MHHQRAQQGAKAQSPRPLAAVPPPQNAGCPGCQLEHTQGLWLWMRKTGRHGRGHRVVDVAPAILWQQLFGLLATGLVSRLQTAESLANLRSAPAASGSPGCMRSGLRAACWTTSSRTGTGGGRHRCVGRARATLANSYASRGAARTASPSCSDCPNRLLGIC